MSAGADGAWAVGYHDNGVVVQAVYGSEVEALRSANDSNGLSRAFWLPYGIEPMDAFYPKTDPTPLATTFPALQDAHDGLTGLTIRKEPQR